MATPKERRSAKVARPDGRATSLYNRLQLPHDTQLRTDRPGRGGARNRKDRVSLQISTAATYELVEAQAFARQTGVPFNRFITISWFKADVDDEQAQGHIARFLKSAGGWLRSQQGQFAWLYVRECDPRSAIGSHVHILAHVPPHLATSFGRRTRGWIAGVTGKRYVKGTIKSRAVGRSSRTFDDNHDAYMVNLAQVMAYVLKGAASEARRVLKLPGPFRPGPVVGKRTGTSQNIGKAARGGARWSAQEGVSPHPSPRRA